MSVLFELAFVCFSKLFLPPPPPPTTFGAMMKHNIPILILIMVCVGFFGCSEVGTRIAYYTLTFDGNGAEGDPPPVMSVPALQPVPIPGRGELEYTDMVFLNWNTEADGTGTSYNPGDKRQFAADTVLYARWQQKESGKDYRTFWAQDIDDNQSNWYTVEAVRRAVGTNCIIYADILADIANGTINDITAEYDSNIHDKIINAFGDFDDMEQSGEEGYGKVILLLLDIKDGYINGDSGGYVAGYFDSTHMYETTTYSYSNRADMLFIDVNPGLVDDNGDGLTDELDQMYSTIAHELQHLINFSRTTGSNRKDLWINEGLSTAAEYIYNPANTSRIDYFNDSNTLIEGYYGTIPYGNNFFVWEGYWEKEYGDVLADYATAYLFFRWLGIHASNGMGIYKEIINNTNGNYLSVTATASNRINSQFSSWEKLLGAWMTANYYNSSTGFYGYKNDPDIGSAGGLDVGVLDLMLDLDYNYLWLSPGEGVFSEQSGSISTGSGDHIRYRGLTKTPLTPPVENSPYAGTTLLTFNANTDWKGGDDEKGYLAGIAGTGTGPALSALPAGLPVRAGSASAGGKAYPVSFGDKAAGLDKPGKAAPRPRPGAR
jgi:hypothetical protein